MDKYEFIHNVIKHISDRNLKMVRYYGMHSRRVKKGVREVRKKLGLVVNYIVKQFSWRKNKEEYTGKDPLKCDKCGGEMLLYKISYHDKKGVLREYGGLDNAPPINAGYGFRENLPLASVRFVALCINCRFSLFRQIYLCLS